MGSEEAKEKAEFGGGKRKRGPSTKQREAAKATELDQQQEAAERKQRKEAPAKSAVEIAELSVGTGGSEFELNQWHRRALFHDFLLFVKKRNRHGFVTLISQVRSP